MAERTQQHVHVRNGIQDALPVALGYIPAAIAYGLLAKGANLPLFAVIGMSLLVYAGASQFAAVNMVASGQSAISTIVLTFILNLRHFLMTTTVASRLSEPNRAKRALIAFGVTDETFSVASFRDKQLSTPYLLGLNSTAYLAWLTGSCLGYLAGGILPDALQAGMGIALYALFVGLLVPSVQQSRVGLWITLAAMALNMAAQALLPAGLAIVVVALVVAGVATLVVPEQEVDSMERGEEAGR